jgi:(1->4)-alpha-D-glucan 1-alpha-D-glucosylmutase
VSRKHTASYRVQLHRDFGFAEVAHLVDYLDRLGISHLYLSPILQSRSGSQHGYDVVDHDRVDGELGGIEGLRALAAAWAGEIIVDIVPNHMAVTDPNNRWWWDVLKRGPASDFVDFFDIDWDPTEERLKRSILVPILGDHYGRVLEAGELKLDVQDDETVVRYYEHVLPLAPSSRPHDIDAINSDANLIHEILEAQYYRLAYWKAAGEQLNYRRFFAIADLAALRVDRAEVFEASHATLLGLVQKGIIDGLRVDHIDGLRYPREYLERLAAAAPGAYVVVEKILEGDEDLPGEWSVHGTTGYEFIAHVDGLFVDPDAEKPLSDFYERFTQSESDIEEMARNSKLQLMSTELATDIERLTELFISVCEDRRRYRDFTRTELRETIKETLASLHVYRTYADARDGSVSETDRYTIEHATTCARDRRPDLDPELFGLLGDVLLLRAEGDDESALAMRFQQASGSVMAKGIEDTLFYRYNRFVSLNEVGGAPEHFGRTVESFHQFNEHVHKSWPRTMLASSTHDTKRSEDVRARLAVLSEIPDEWAAAVTSWAQHNDRHRRGDWPDRNLEYLLYQTLVGAWPLSIDRAVGYMDKAAKEAKVHTSWIAPNDHHDSALEAFVRAVMEDASFMSEVASFVAGLVTPGYINSLAQTLLKVTSPGVPDFYQGTEVWDFSLVDPDNRRPVDYEKRRRLLDEVSTVDAAGAWEKADSGAPKMFLIERVLAARGRHPQAFQTGSAYQPLAASGAAAGHVIAFLRGHDVIAIAPRLIHGAFNGWHDTTIQLPSGRWTNVITEEVIERSVSMSELLSAFPVALLEREVT